MNEERCVEGFKRALREKEGACDCESEVPEGLSDEVGLEKEASSYDTSNDGDSERESESIRGRPARNALSS